jgi:hypothetical protein
LDGEKFEGRKKKGGGGVGVGGMKEEMEWLNYKEWN